MKIFFGGGGGDGIRYLLSANYSVTTERKAEIFESGFLEVV